MFATPTPLASAGEVLSSFLIPFGLGVPAGVLLAKNRGLTWPAMMALYFFSDVILACVFEPLLLNSARLVKRFKFFTQVRNNYRETMRRMNIPASPNPFALVMISFVIDPMTGRTAALAAGHRFFTGWLIAITGDMITFSMMMVSTLWLDNVLGNQFVSALVILAVMVFIHWVFRRVRLHRSTSPKI
jgi:hypothetical protein